MTDHPAAAAASTRVTVAKDGSLEVSLSGDWTRDSKLPPTDDVRSHISSTQPPSSIRFLAEQLGEWDSLLLTWLAKIVGECRDKNIPVNDEALPKGARALLKLAFEVPARAGARRTAKHASLLQRVGEGSIALWKDFRQIVWFVGETVVVMLRMVRGKARFQKSDLLVYIQECGADALPIVSLISLLVGMILAFIGGAQLGQFGANVYIADLVGIAMVREMGAMMTGIVLAGRTGAAYAAQIGTMMVNEEVDALKTMGLSPMEFLVLPRMLALILMTPLLTIYADLMGVLGGAIIGINLYDLGATEYLHRTGIAITLPQVWVGVSKGALFGVLISLAGCLRGMQSGRSAAAVGQAATSAVVTGIVLIIVFDWITTIIYQALGI